MSFVSAVIRLVVGVAFGVVCALALSPALAAVNPQEGGSTVPIITFGIIGLVALAGLLAPTVRRAFGRGFLLSGLSLVALPLSAALLSGKAATEVISSAAAQDQGFAAVGAGLGAAAFTGAAAFIGLILGSIFIILGLVLALGGRREVIVVERTASSARREPTINRG